ncbi:hypothetical protein R1sor_020151 [Riccia sorocarpa]|uniref:S1-like domain-containing protein n=1 Tax=Riccia sorocarpa TaxID=122646 RepID=A0ABD3IG75_9MARC
MSSKGRKGLKQGSLEGCPEPQPGQILMRVVALRGSNLIEVEDDDGQKTLCMLPARFHKSMWIKRGNFVIVDEGDREKVREAGSKVTGTVAQVLYDEHMRELRKTSFWSPSFDVPEKATKAPAEEDCSKPKQISNAVSDSKNGGREEDEQEDDDDDDGLPPLEPNPNRSHAMSLVEESETESDEE